MANEYKNVKEMTIQEVLEEMKNEPNQRRKRTLVGVLKNAGYEYSRLLKTYVYEGEGEAPFQELVETFTKESEQENKIELAEIQEEPQTKSSEVKTTKKSSDEMKTTQTKSSSPELKQEALINISAELEELKKLLTVKLTTPKQFDSYQIYDDIRRVPLNVDQVRSAYNMSKDTTDRLKKFANVRRLPLQDLVELAVLNLLEQYKED